MRNLKLINVLMLSIGTYSINASTKKVVTKTLVVNATSKINNGKERAIIPINKMIETSKSVEKPQINPLKINASDLTKDKKEHKDVTLTLHKVTPVIPSSETQKFTHKKWCMPSLYNICMFFITIINSFLILSSRSFKKKDTYSYNKTRIEQPSDKSLKYMSVLAIILISMLVLHGLITYDYISFISKENLILSHTFINTILVMVCISFAKKYQIESEEYYKDNGNITVLSSDEMKLLTNITQLKDIKSNIEKELNTKYKYASFFDNTIDWNKEVGDMFMNEVKKKVSKKSVK